MYTARLLPFRPICASRRPSALILLITGSCSCCLATAYSHPVQTPVALCLQIKQWINLNKIYLGICSAISSKLSDGFIGVFSNRRDGAKVKWPVVSLSLRKTLAPRRCRCRCWATDFFRLFSCSRCKLCSRKKNIDILSADERMNDVFGGAGELIMSSLSLYIFRFSLYIFYRFVFCVFLLRVCDSCIRVWREIREIFSVFSEQNLFCIFFYYFCFAHTTNNTTD